MSDHIPQPGRPRQPRGRPGDRPPQRRSRRRPPRHGPGLGDRPEATAARCLDADTTALTLEATTPTETLILRIPYDEPITDAGLRKATVKLTRRARSVLFKT